MKNDTYYLNQIQRDYKIEGGNFNSAKREEHAYTDLFTMTNIRTSLRSGIAENEPGARGGSDNIDPAIDRPRSNMNRSKIIIAVLVVATMIAVAVAIALAIAVARKDESSDNPEPVKGSKTTRGTPMTTSSLLTTTTTQPTAPSTPTTTITSTMSMTATTTTPLTIMTTPTTTAPSTTTSLPQSTEPQTIEQQCRNGATLIPHPSECQLYYNCSLPYHYIPVQSRFEQHMQECPYPEQFNTETMECENFEKVECGKRKDTKDACQYLANECYHSTCLGYCHKEFGSCVNKTDGANVHDFYGRWLIYYYVTCYKERSMSVERCPQQARFFHPDLKECVTLDMVPQEHGGTMPKCEGRVDGKYLDDLGRCNQFTVCASGAVAEIIKCKTGELYDALPRACVEFAEACEPCGEMNRCVTSTMTTQSTATSTLITSLASTTTTTLTSTETKMTTPTTITPSTTTSLPQSTEPQTIEQQCRNGATLLPHPSECQLYYNCSLPYYYIPIQSRFEQHMQECPYPDQFNTKTMECENFEQVECGKRKDTKDACQYLANECYHSTCLGYCHREFGSCVNKTDGANVHDFYGRWLVYYYVMCYKERSMSVERCPQQARFFHPDLKECVTLDMVPQEHGGTMPKCEGRVDGKYLDDLGRCNQFTVCASGAVAEIIKCKKGELYDALPQTCVESAKACEPCGEMNSCLTSTVTTQSTATSTLITSLTSTTTTTSTSTATKMTTPTTPSTTTSLPQTTATEPQTIEQQCENGATLIPHQSECQLYYNCSLRYDYFMYNPFEQHMQECPYPEQFNTETMECEDFEKVECGTRKDTKDGCQYRANQCTRSHCIPCQVRMPSCLNKTDGANVDDNRPWTPYYVTCYKERFVSKEVCHGDVNGNTQFFHPDIKECVPLDMISQEHGGTMPKCEGREDGNYLDDVGRCHQFTVCASGAVAEIIRCKEGEVYDTLPQKCVEESEACEPCGEMNRC